MSISVCPFHTLVLDNRFETVNWIYAKLIMQTHYNLIIKPCLELYLGQSLGIHLGSCQLIGGCFPDESFATTHRFRSFDAYLIRQPPPDWPMVSERKLRNRSSNLCLRNLYGGLITIKSHWALFHVTAHF